MTIQEQISSWEELFEIAKANTSAQWVLRLGMSPSSAPIASSLPKLAAGTKPPVLLYRDTNSWCPFCERVWFALLEKSIPFEVEFIDLRNKPEWYTQMVPTGLVPAAKIKGELVYESKDILLALEEEFAPSLLPIDARENAQAQGMIDDCETNDLVPSGYRFLLGRIDSESSDSPEIQLSQLQIQFENKLDEIETALAKFSSPYFFRDFSLVDIMYAPGLWRLANNLPRFRGYSLVGNERYPLLNQWLEAIEQRPSYLKIQPDPITSQLIIHKVFRQPFFENFLKSSLPTVELDSTVEARMEAAAKLSNNHQAVIADVLKNSGIQGLAPDSSVDFLTEVIDFYLRLLAQSLIQGEHLPFPGGLTGGKQDSNTTKAAIGAVALAYLRNRVCAPRDMSASAATAFRAAVEQMLASIY